MSQTPINSTHHHLHHQCHHNLLNVHIIAEFNLDLTLQFKHLLKPLQKFNLHHILLDPLPAPNPKLTTDFYTPVANEINHLLFSVMYLAAARSNNSHTLHFAMLTGDDAKVVQHWQRDDDFPAHTVTIPNVPTFNILNPGYTTFPSLWWTKSDITLFITRTEWTWGPPGQSIPPTRQQPARTANMIIHDYPIYVCMDFSTNLSPILCLDPMQPPPPAFVQETPLPCFMLKFAQFPTRTSTVTSTYNIVVTQEYDRDDTNQEQDPYTVEI